MPPSAATQKLQGPAKFRVEGKPAGLFPAGLTATLQFGDIDELAAAIKNWNHEGIQLAPGEFHSRLDLVHTSAMQIHRVQLSPSILVRGFAVPGSIVLGIQSGGRQRAKWRGRVMADNDVVIFDGEKEIDFQTNGPSEITAISIDKQLFEKHVNAICGRMPAGDPASDRLKILSTAKSKLLIQSWSELTDAALSWGNQLADGVLARQFEAKIIEVLYSNVAQPTREPGLAERCSIAQRARQYIVLNMDEPMTIADICTAVGTAERTLHLGFRECFGVTPKRFLKLLRLNAAHRGLMRPQSGTTVTGVALRWGFFHLANFAADYRRLFAESPSQTLRKATGAA